MKLTPDVLLNLGFEPATLNRYTSGQVFRLLAKEGYFWQFQVELGNYPDTNPNVGIVSLYSHAEMISTYTEEDPEAEVLWEEQETPIAWYVTTVERLKAIYTSLTQQKLATV